jgi:undecaprenyl phosphate-alpha-L-ara4FN deformylase
MNEKMYAKTIHIRVDVDFNVGLKYGIPFLLDQFAQKNIQATFFVVMGPDTLFRHGSRAKNKSYQKRLRSFNWFRLVWYFAPAYIKSWFFSQVVGPAAPEILKRITIEGHELGIHGYDHALWADRCFELGQEETKRQMDLAVSQFRELFPNKNWVWGAPNWKCNPFMLEHLETLSIPYSSDTRGCTPYYPSINGKRISVLQFPINLPCLHELIQVGIPRDQISNIVSQCVDRSDYNLLCIHDYYEGLMERNLFENVIDRLLDQGFQFKPLSSAYEVRSTYSPKISELSKIRVPGGITEVSCQDEFLANNYFYLLK